MIKFKLNLRPYYAYYYNILFSDSGEGNNVRKDKQRSTYKILVILPLTIVYRSFVVIVNM